MTDVNPNVNAPTADSDSPSVAPVTPLDRDFLGPESVGAEVLAEFVANQDQPGFRAARALARKESEAGREAGVISAERAFGGFLGAHEASDVALAATRRTIEQDRKLSDEGRKAAFADAEKKLRDDTEAKSAESATAFERIVGTARARADEALRAALTPAQTKLSSSERHEAAMRFLLATQRLDARAFARAVARQALPTEWGDLALEGANHRLLADRSSAAITAVEELRVAARQLRRERARVALTNPDVVRAAALLAQLDRLAQHFKAAKILLSRDSAHASSLRARLEAEQRELG